MDDAFSHTEVNSLHSVKILLCYLLNKLDMPVSPDDLLQIVMDSEIINYFYYNDAVCALLDNGALVLKKDADGGDVYVLGEKGVKSAEYFKDNVSGFFRERLMTSALKFMSDKRHSQTVRNEIEEAPNGCYLKTVIRESGFDLMEMKLYAPDAEQAKFMGDKIHGDPVEFYRRVMEYILSNKEEIE